mmetsp:Transcript_91572/g.259254  ORF Transcript_91572/g.259254 Transcript_91572/m.259254 type:complete len:159 (+) Transcript_91572:105-581(+)
MFLFSRAGAPSKSAQGAAAGASSSSDPGVPGGQGAGADVVSLSHASIPADGSNRPTSIGSTHHASGMCKPCVFVTSKAGCTRGIHCRFCHLHHAPAGPQPRGPNGPDYERVTQRLLERLRAGEGSTALLTGTEFSHAVASDRDMRDKMRAHFAKSGNF